MSRTTSVLAIALVLAAAAVTTSPATADKPREWTHTWVSMPQQAEPHNMPPAPFTQDGVTFKDATLRQTVHVSVGGEQIRLRFSNAFGGAPLPITAVSIALPAEGKAGVGAVQPGSARPVTFNGRASTVVPMGALVVSDPIDFRLAPQSNLTVTTYLAAGQASNAITSHPGSRTSSHLLAGNHVTDDDLPGATRTDHWYLLSGVEVLSRATAVAIVGDSLTDGRGSTTNGNDRWPDRLLARLQQHPTTARTAVLNQAAGGNRVLADGLGPNVLARYDRDVLATTGVTSVLVFEGVNDLGTAPATEAAQKQVADDLIAAYQQLVARSVGLRVYGATITPFGGNTGYDDPDGHRERARQRVNEWIRTSGAFAEVVDFDRVARDPRDPRRLNPAYDTGDHLHFNPAGYQALADAVPARWFR
ncbi:SGNH/GDSL hydrolase family protein [Saccharothrix variisporea]|uniref:Lysophospholipase L1-like esterase n=1 Tax=Saccharothrix variisporea TaxID=543527 RepID=A0A495X3S1_9PSEU|nr:SGNH/GDSL hydrolase family protein [Saccharothrix variisporea]RKT68600.1 lysophospholipase L1-like esterase [Saccharothrix variisporea]